jgi:hypothetical protein
MKNLAESLLGWIVPFLLPGLILWGMFLSGGTSGSSSYRNEPPENNESADTSTSTRLSGYRAIGVVSPFDCPPCIESVAGELQRLAVNERWRGKIILLVAGDSAGSSRFIRRMKRRFALSYPLLPLDSALEVVSGGISINATPVVLLFVREHLQERVLNIRPETLNSFSLVVDSLLDHPHAD